MLLSFEPSQLGLLVLDWCIVELLQGLFLRRELPFPIRDSRSFPLRVFVLADHEHSQPLQAAVTSMLLFTAFVKIR